MDTENLRYGLNSLKRDCSVMVPWDMNTYINGNGLSKYKNIWKQTERS